MADQSNVAPLKGADDLLNVATIAGRISDSRMHDGSTYTELKLPAPDVYSSPQTIEIKSKRSLGRVGEEWRGGVRIGGFYRTFDRKPDERTGEIEKGRQVIVRLEAIEA